MPSDEEWTIFTTYLTNNGYGYGGSGDDIGKSMASTSGWSSSSTAGQVGNDQGSNNSSGFNAVPGGFRYNDGGFGNLGGDAIFRSSTPIGSSGAYGRGLHWASDGVSQHNPDHRDGYSVRCLKD